MDAEISRIAVILPLAWSGRFASHDAHRGKAAGGQPA
jgi:hypothetical protein